MYWDCLSSFRFESGTSERFRPVAAIWLSQIMRNGRKNILLSIMPTVVEGRHAAAMNNTSWVRMTYSIITFSIHLLQGENNCSIARYREYCEENCCEIFRFWERTHENSGAKHMIWLLVWINRLSLLLFRRVWKLVHWPKLKVILD